MKRPFFILIVLDGFGCRAEGEWNAIAQARTPRFDDLFAHHIWTSLEASGLRVGLPAGQMGNSEVGHLNMGAGRVVDQDIVRISKATSSGEIAGNETLVEHFAALKRRNGALHFIGLLSDGGVHSHQEHMHGLVDAAIANGVAREDGSPNIFVHAILDGRDTAPRSAIKYVRDLQHHIAAKRGVALASMVGRYYAMDRDRRWERVQRAYDLFTLGRGEEARDPIAAIEASYARGVHDEFVEPVALLDDDGKHCGRVADGDMVVFFNFRADRMRQIITAFNDETCDGFVRVVTPKLDVVCMVSYHEGWSFPVVFHPDDVRGHLGEVLAREQMKQLRIAETEKYAHVTFFFNGGSDRASEGENRILIPSSKVATYDLKPEMSVVELSDRVVEEIASQQYDAIIMNIANPDMVGHTGVMDAAVKAVEATDFAVGKILDATEKVDGIAMITADHGNCELMFDVETGQPHTAHTTFPVPLILVDGRRRFAGLKKGGALENIAPTALDLLGIEKSPEMTAESLLIRKQ